MAERLGPPYEKHHLLFRKRAFVSDRQRNLRCHPSLIVPAHTVNHRLLHLRVEPLDAPSQWMTDVMMQMVKGIGRPSTPLDGPTRLVSELETLADGERSCQRADEAATYAWYLNRQLGYLTLSLDAAQAALTYPVQTLR